MNNRLQEIKEFLLKIGLVFILFMISRWLFIYFNSDLIKVETLSEILRLSYYGLKFDLVSIIYLQAIFIIMFFLPGRPSSNLWYNKTLSFFYFFGSFIGLGLNFVDFAYYRFNLTRINAQFFESIENEDNKFNLILHFSFEYIHLIILYFFVVIIWIYTYRLIKVKLTKRKFDILNLIK